MADVATNLEELDKKGSSKQYIMGHVRSLNMISEGKLTITEYDQISVYY